MYNLIDIDLFRKMEDEISFYRDKGEVYIIGDLNSRIGKKPDYIVDDLQLNDFDDDFSPDTPIRRQSADNVCNRFGDCLLDLCKSVDFRIVNGRLFTDTHKMTCYTANGESVVDYVVTSQQNFEQFSDMRVQNFNEFSNHAPISFSLKINTARSSTAVPTYKKVNKWDENLKNDFTNILRQDIILLNNFMISNDNVDENVHFFTNFVTTRAKAFFEKNVKISQECKFNCSNSNNRQAWFDEDCKNKKQTVKEALKEYNIFKSEETRKNVLDSKKDYKYLCRKKKQKYFVDRGRKMNTLRKKKPKEFWKIFKRKKSSPNHDITDNDFFEYFKQLSSENEDLISEQIADFVRDFDARDATFEVLDERISQAEILKAINGLSKNKSSGVDDILNEYFINASNILLEPLEVLFNKIFDSGKFPADWSTGIIIPIHKKGDVNDPNNYRGITLVSCFAKLYTTVLNNRLKEWTSENEVITDAQFGFKSNHTTIDAVFILKHLIDKHIQSREKLYCAFIDLKKAFDSISRVGLWYKLIHAGIDGKLFRTIRSLYNDVSLRVKCLTSLTDVFSCDIGLLQGEIMSPILFSLFLNDVEMQLSDGGNEGITIEQLSIYLLLFADDAVIFSETPEGLQKSLDNFEIYCKKWNLTVNVEKTKVVVFRKGGILARNEIWSYNGQLIETVAAFNYLGIVLSSGGSFIQATKTLADKGIKAMHNLFDITKESNVPVNIMFQLFDSLVASVLSYGCEIWGFSNAECIERVHRKFCKRILGVKLSTNNYALYTELGRYPLFVERQLRIIKYWFKLSQNASSNIILQSIYDQMKNHTDNDRNNSSWTSKVKNLLERNGFAEVWHFPASVDVNLFLRVLKTRLVDTFISESREGIRNCSSLSLFKELNTTYEAAPYLKLLCNGKYRKTPAKLRLSSHSLAIESGRHNGIPRERRKCTLCNINDIEDEYHFIIICPLYNDLRKQYIPNYFIQRPSMFKFIQLLSSTSVKKLKNLAIFVTKATEMRNSNIVVEVT